MQLKERRSAPRYEVDLAGQIRTRGNYCCSVTITNISSSGLQCQFLGQHLPEIFNDLDIHNKLEPIHLRLTISLLELNATVEIDVGIVYLNRCNENNCSIGCRFEAFIEEGDKLFEAYLSQLP